MPTIPQPFCSIAWLAVWNRNLPTDPMADPDSLSQRKRNDLLMFISPEQLEEDRKHRKLGLAQGLVDFTRMLSNPQQEIRSVKTSSQRMIFIEPEPEYFVHVAIDLARYPSNSSSGHARQTSNNSQASRASQENNGIASDDGIEDEVFLSSLQQAYQTFRLLNGTFSSILASQGRTALESKLEVFFEDWRYKWMAASHTIGRLDFHAHLSATETSDSLIDLSSCKPYTTLCEHHPSLSLLLFDHHKLVHSSTPSLAKQDKALLARHLSTNVCEHAKTSSSSSTKPSLKGKERADGTKPDSWKSTFGMSGLGSYLALPSFYSTPTQPETSTSTSESSSGGWMRAVSWGSTPKPDPPDPKPPLASPNLPVSLESTKINLNEIAEAMSDPDEDSDDSDIADHIAKLAEKGGYPEDQVNEDDETPKASAIRVFTSEDAKASLEDERAKEEPPVQPTLEEQDKSKSLNAGKSAKVVLQKKIYLSADGRWADLSCIKRDSLLLAAISENPAATLEIALVEFLSAFELPLIEAQEPALEHRHLLYQTSDGSTQSHAWPDPNTSWSGSKNAAKEADVMGALLAGHRSLESEPSTNECYIRTGTSQWAITKRTDNGTDINLILPKKFGQEGSLVDAAREMSKLESRA